MAITITLTDRQALTVREALDEWYVDADETVIEDSRLEALDIVAEALANADDDGTLTD